MIETIALQSAGDMGHRLGAVLRARGYRVVTALAGRSDATRSRAERAGLEDAGDLDGLAQAADLILSVLPPSAARGFARDCAAALLRTGRTPVFVDANAIAPDTAKELQRLIAEAGARFVDGGIIGGPPRAGGPATRLYLSGPGADELASLFGESEAGAIDARAIGPAIGSASGLKMVYAGLTKGTMTLHAAVLITAQRLGLADELERELRESQAEAFARMGVLPSLPADAGRWIGEMQEIAACFAAAGVTGQFHEGAERIFRIMDATPLAAETRETLDRSRSLAEAIRVFAEHLEA